MCSLRPLTSEMYLPVIMTILMGAAVPPGNYSLSRNISMSGLSDNLRAPGINSLSCVKEMSSSDMSVEETETPPCEDAQATLTLSSEDESCRSGCVHSPLGHGHSLESLVFEG